MKEGSLTLQDNNDYARHYFFDRFENRIPTRRHNPDIVEYAEQTVITTGKYRGLKFSHDRAPYLKRPMQCLSPESPYREIIMMFPAQSGKTFTANTVAMYYIEAVPSEIIYATSNELMAMKWLEREIEPRALQAGIIFRTETENVKSRKTGNTSYSKIFPGGNIDIASANSPGQLASATKRIMLGDEVDRWKIKLGEQGSTLNQLRARGQAWEMQQKIFWFSTPSSESESIIYILYLQGTQEQYFVPCPYCGHMQLMDFEEDRGYGLVWEYKNNRINRKSIELICENKTCGRGIKESSKPRMLKGGEWRPQTEAEYEYMVSFHLNGIYSFQLSWYDMVIAYTESRDDPLKKQDFDQLKMGKPHRGSGIRPKAEKLIERKGTYKSGDVPPGVLYLTIGIDVQRGSKNDEENPPRLEMQVLGIGAKYRIWSVDYKIFYGDTSNPFSGAWEELYRYAEKTQLIYTRVQDGRQFRPGCIFIDSSDGERMQTVYQFCQQSGWQNTYPIKGQKDIVKGFEKSPDKITESSAVAWKRNERGAEGDALYIIATALYKNKIYNSLNNIERQPNDPQDYGFIDFPRDYPDKYFDQLTSEEKMANGGYESHGRRNEVLDTFVYAYCGGDVFLKSEVERHKINIAASGFPCRFHGVVIKNKNELIKIGPRLAIEYLIWETDPQGLYKHYEERKIEK
jgi:phage terminase large subunit GpA-like protein